MASPLLHEPPRAAHREPPSLDPRDAVGLVRWGHASFGSGLVLSTSFGIQSAATLHLVTQEIPGIPVIWIDTGYLPPETYRFAEALTERLKLNLHAIQPALSPARMEALHGRLWESEDLADLRRYDQLRKREPMARALAELGATAWISGIRAEQTAHRRTLPRVTRQDGHWKLSPILHWSTRDVHEYLKAHDLPYHPLFEQGYATVGDAHSSRPLAAGDAHERDTRFGGRKQECGLHLDDAQAASLEGSQL